MLGVRVPNFVGPALRVLLSELLGKKWDYGAPGTCGAGGTVSAKNYWECCMNAESRVIFAWRLY